MKLLSIGLDRSLFVEGSNSQQRMRAQAEHLDELHIIVHTPRGYTPLQLADNLWVHPTNSLSKVFFIRDACRIGRRLILATRTAEADHPTMLFDLITTQDSFETGCVGVKLKKKFGLPLHMQAHGDLFRTPHWRQESFLNRARWYMGRRNLKWANRIRTVNKKCADGLVNDFGIDARRIDTFPIAVDTSRFESATVNPEFARRFDGKFVVLTVCRLSTEKNLPMLIRSFATFAQDHPDALLVIVGDGSQRTSLEALVSQLDIDSQVLFEGPQSDVAPYYKTAQVFAITSNHEGFGRTVVEANASGCPVIMTDVGLAGEHFLDEVHGRVIPVGDGNALVDCLADSYVATFAHDGFVSAEFPYAKIDTLRVGMEDYLRSWNDAITPAIMMITQNVDSSDPIMGFTCEWMKEFNSQTNLFSVMGLRVDPQHTPHSLDIQSLGKENHDHPLLWILRFYALAISRRHSYDMLFVHMNPIWAVLFFPLKLILRKKVCLWFIHARKSLLLRIATSCVDTIYTATPTSFPLTSRKVTPIGHGIPMDIIPHRTNHTVRKIVITGRISPIKHIDMTLTGIAASSHVFDVDIIGPIDDPTYFESLQQQARQMKSQVNFLGPMSNTHLLSQLASYDVSINATPTGSFDKALLEAAAAGLIVLARNTSYQEFFPQNLHDLLFFDNAEQLGERLNSLADGSAPPHTPLDISPIIRAEFSLAKLISRICYRL